MFLDLFRTQKFINRSFLINSNVIKSFEFDVRTRNVNIEFYNVTKLQTTLAINTLIVFFFWC